MKMTVKEIAEVFGISGDVVKKRIKEIFPEKMKHGKITYLNESEVTILKQRIFENSSLITHDDRHELPKTNLEKKLLIKQAIDFMNEEIKTLQLENQQLKPKAIEYDKFMSGNNVQSMNEVSKIFGIGHRKLMRLLKDKGILMENNTPYQKYAHYFKVIVKPIANGENKPVTLVKPEGVNYISKKVLN